MRKRRRTDGAQRLAAILLAACAAPAGHADEEPAAPAVPEEPVVVETRIPLVTRFPRYPATARRNRIEGEATVCFKIGPDGRVLDPVVESSTHDVFEEPALEAIRESSFEPLAPGELASAERTCRTFRFRLDRATQADDV
jgi:TonB family protein